MLQSARLVAAVAELGALDEGDRLCLKMWSAREQPLQVLLV